MKCFVCNRIFKSRRALVAHFSGLREKDVQHRNFYLQEKLKLLAEFYSLKTTYELAQECVIFSEDLIFQLYCRNFGRERCEERQKSVRYGFSVNEFQQYKKKLLEAFNSDEPARRLSERKIPEDWVLAFWKKNFGEEACKKRLSRVISKVLTGSKRTFRRKSTEHRRKIGVAHFGKKRDTFSREWRQKLSEAHRRRVELGLHNWIDVAPFGRSNNFYERVLDLFFSYEALEGNVNRKTSTATFDHSSLWETDFSRFEIKFDLEIDEWDHLKRQDLDRRRNELFRKDGWLVLRHWWYDIEFCMDRVVQMSYFAYNRQRKKFKQFQLPKLKWTRELQVIAEEQMKKIQISKFKNVLEQIERIHFLEKAA